MNKTEFVGTVAEKAGITKKDSGILVNAVLESLVDALVDTGEVNLAPFGKMQVVERKARKGRNPQTGEELDIPAKNAVKFTASKKVKDAVNV